MLLKGEDLNQKLMFPKYVLNWGDVVKKLMQLKRITNEGRGRGLQPAETVPVGIELVK